MERPPPTPHGRCGRPPVAETPKRLTSSNYVRAVLSVASKPTSLLSLCLRTLLCGSVDTVMGSTSLGHAPEANSTYEDTEAWTCAAFCVSSPLMRRVAIHSPSATYETQNDLANTQPTHVKRLGSASRDQSHRRRQRGKSSSVLISPSHRTLLAAENFKEHRNPASSDRSDVSPSP